MVAQIYPTRLDVNDRFPMLSFIIRTGEAQRRAEVAVATELMLFRPEHKAQRTPSNFFSSRASGALLVPRGEVVYMLPAEVLARFVGADRLYFALATAPEQSGGGLLVDVLPSEGSPYVSLRGLTGRSLKRVRLLPSRQHKAAGYGMNGAAALEWAGDTAIPGQQPASAAPKVPAPTQSTPVKSEQPYDDGFGPMPAAEQPNSVAATQSFSHAQGTPDDSYPPLVTKRKKEILCSFAHNQGEIALLPAPYEAIERLKAAFTGNAQAGNDKKDCITIVNEALRQYYGSYLKDSNGARKKLGSTIQETMKELQIYDLAEKEMFFEFNGASGEPTRGVVRPDQLCNSVSDWLLILADSRKICASYLFGLSIMDGHHSVIICVDFNGIGDESTRIYWADQNSNNGWEDVTETLDDRITSLTQRWWDTFPVNKKPRTRATVWPLNPGEVSATGQVLSNSFEKEDYDLEGIEGYEEETVAFASMLEAKICSDNFCPVNHAASAGSDHFSLGEFACKDGTVVPEKFRGSVQLLMNNLEVLRNELGGSPITINSGYRTCAYNSKLEGAVGKSRHLCGQAADITVKGFTPEDVYNTIERLIAEGKMQQGGIGIYNKFVHYDVRGKKARWDKRRKNADAIQQAVALSIGPFSLNWDDVQLIPQRHDVSCWAAAASMVIGWRDQISIDEEIIADISGRAPEQRGPLRYVNVQAFADAVGFDYQEPQSYTTDGFRRLLETKGPLWVCKQAAQGINSGHAVVVVGIYSDGNETYVRIADPWDRVVGTPGVPGNYLNTHTTGSRYIMAYGDFASEYEWQQERDNALPKEKKICPLQILHSKSTQGHLPIYSSPPTGYAQSLSATRKVTGRALNASSTTCLPPPPKFNANTASPVPQRQRVSGKTADVSWELDQYDGMKAPAGTAVVGAIVPIAGTPVRLSDWPYIGEEPDKRTYAEVVIDWRHQGGMVGDVRIDLPTAAAPDEFELKVTADISDGPDTAAIAALKVTVQHEFTSRAELSQVYRAVTEVILYGDGRHERQGTWES